MPHVIADALQISTEGRWSDIRFGSIDARPVTYEVGVEVDTRLLQGWLGASGAEGDDGRAGSGEEGRP